MDLLVESYPLEEKRGQLDFSNDRKMLRIAKKYKMKSPGSGAGFGARDVEFTINRKTDIYGFIRDVSEKCDGVSFSFFANEGREH